MKIVLPDPGGIQQASDILRAGEIVAYPTETVYGLGVDPHNPRALDGLFDAKGCAERHPVLLIVDDIAQLKRVADSIPPRAAELMAAMLPRRWRYKSRVARSFYGDIAWNGACTWRP